MEIHSPPARRFRTAAVAVVVMVLFGPIVPVAASTPDVRWVAVLNRQGTLGVEQLEASSVEEAPRPS